MTTVGANKRSLILAGGGTKVAFQAGVLQVWLDEADLTFDHADGASGGVFNLAMWCQGMSGTRIADNWRNYRPLGGIQPNMRPLVSLFKLERFKRNVIAPWGLSWPAIRATDREATFNLYNFSRQRLEVLEPAAMDENRMVSAVSLPMWFPPVSINGDNYVDAVMATDANIDEALRRGADELWIIWTVSTRGDWHNGFIAQYFQMIEAMANSKLEDAIHRIDVNNAAVAHGESGEFGRHITVHMLKSEVPLHYLLNLTQDRMAAAVELGVARARSWCVTRGIALKTPPDPVPSSNPVSVQFTEQMVGAIAMGSPEPEDLPRFRGSAQYSALRFRLTIKVGDIERFVREPSHRADAHGWVYCDALGGRRTVERGFFNLFVNQADPDDKRMLYQLWFRDSADRPLTLFGEKLVVDDPGFDLWSDTTTLHARVVPGHVTLEQFGEGDVIASGVLKIRPLMFLRQLTTFRAHGSTAWASAKGLARFLRLFTGSLWDVYLTPALANSPF